MRYSFAVDFVLVASFFQTFLELNRLDHCERSENISSVRPDPVLPSSRSLTLFPAGFEVQSLNPYAFETHFTTMQTKEWGLQATRPVAVKRRSLSHSLVLSLAPFRLLATSEKGRGEKAENRSPAASVRTERRRPAAVKTIQSRRPSSTQNSLYQVSWSHMKWHHLYSMIRSTAKYYKIYTVSHKNRSMQPPRY